MTKASQEIKENILRKNRICRLIEEKKVISFDIFDTLLLRPYRKPEDLFELIEKEYQISGFATARKMQKKTSMPKMEKLKKPIWMIYTVYYLNINNLSKLSWISNIQDLFSTKK